jgi:hypothetical protein
MVHAELSVHVWLTHSSNSVNSVDQIAHAQAVLTPGAPESLEVHEAPSA